MPIGDGATWGETKPDDDTNLSDGDNYQRDLRVGIRARMAFEHLWPSSQTGTSEAGYHTVITFQPATTAPSTLIVGTTAGALSVVTSGDGYEFFLCSVTAGTTAGSDIQLSAKGALNVGTIAVNSGALFTLVNSDGTTIFTCNPEGDIRFAGTLEEGASF